MYIFKSDYKLLILSVAIVAFNSRIQVRSCRKIPTMNCEKSTGTITTIGYSISIDQNSNVGKCVYKLKLHRHTT